MSTTEAPSWLDLNPAHFDMRKLPAKHRRADPDALWTVADLLPATPAPAAPSPAPMEGQGDLFGQDD